jgi:hypothetical protein
MWWELEIFPCELRIVGSPLISQSICYCVFAFQIVIRSPSLEKNIFEYFLKKLNNIIFFPGDRIIKSNSCKDIISSNKIYLGAHTTQNLKIK